MKLANQLTEAIQRHKRDFSFDDAEAKSRIEQILSQPLLPAEQEKVYKTIARYVNFNFAHQIAQKYPVISREIFDLKREQKIEIDKGSWSKRTYIFETPTVVELPLGEANNGVYTRTVKGKDIKDYDTRDIKISCQIPEITSDARAAIAEAVKYSAELTANAYQDPLISKILIRDQLTKNDIGTPLDAGYSLMWAPSVWDKEVIERDPSILMNYSGARFLVYQWDIPEERNLDAMLREFTQELEKQNKI